MQRALPRAAHGHFPASAVGGRNVTSTIVYHIGMKGVGMKKSPTNVLSGTAASFMARRIERVLNMNIKQALTTEKSRRAGGSLAASSGEPAANASENGRRRNCDMIVKGKLEMFVEMQEATEMINGAANGVRTVPHGTTSAGGSRKVTQGVLPTPIPRKEGVRKLRNSRPRQPPPPPPRLERS